MSISTNWLTQKPLKYFVRVWRFSGTKRLLDVLMLESSCNKGSLLNYLSNLYLVKD